MYTIEELENYINHCQKCPLCKSRKNCVIGDGNIKSKIMLIGEAPGEQEDLSGKAFVGPAGKLLDKMLDAIGLDRNDVYITNILKCRPPRNRNPLPEEQKACMDFLRHQFVIMKPKYIVLLGSIASKAIIDKDFRITKQHGIPIKKGDIIFLPTFHPSALLRDPSKKPQAWQDLLVLKNLIEQVEND